MSSPLQSPAFRWLLTGRTASTLGNSIAPFALAFAVLDLTGSTADLGIVVASRSVMNVGLLLYGGVLADRLPRRAVLLGSALASGVTQALVAVLVLSGSATVPTLALLSAVNGAVAGLGFPASASVLPQTVPPAALPQANAMLRIGLNSSAVLGAAVAGIVVAVVGPGWGIAVDAATFLLGALCYRRLRIDAAPPAARESTLHELRVGWREFVSRRWVWVVVAQAGVVNAATVASEGVLGPKVADQTIGRGAYGVVLAVGAAGLVVGAVIALRVQPRRALRFGVLVLLLLVGPSLALALSPTVLALSVAFFVAAVSLDLFGVAWDISLQQNIPPERLARVYSYDALGSFVAIPLGQVLVGPLAESVGLRATLLGCAVAVVVPTLLALCEPQIRRLARCEPEIG